MKVDLDTQAVFTSPSKSFEDILPAGPSHERFVAPCLDRPKRDRDADPVQAGTGNLRKVFFGLEHNFGFSVFARKVPGPLTMKVL